MQSFFSANIQYLNYKYNGFTSRIRALYYRWLGMDVGEGVSIEQPDRLTNPMYIRVDNWVTIGAHARIEAIRDYQNQPYNGTISIGQNTIINPYSHIAAAASLYIGEWVLMGSRVSIIDHDHGFSKLDTPITCQPLSVAPIKIENHVWIGENVVILKGVTIGAYAIIGANSIVTADIPVGGIAVGNPARVIRQRL